MNKYQEALNYLAKAQKIIDDLAKEETKEKNKTHNQLPHQQIECLILSVLSCSVVPLSVRDMGKACRKIRRVCSSKKEEILGRMFDRGVIGLVRTSQTTKYYAIRGDHQ